MRIRLIASALLILGLATPLVAQDSVRADRILMARDLHTHCTASEAKEEGRLSVGYCLGAITGIADAAMTLNAVLAKKQTICLESDDTAETMRLSFLVFTDRNPEALNLPAATAVIATLQSYFHCENKK